MSRRGSKRNRYVGERLGGASTVYDWSPQYVTYGTSKFFKDLTGVCLDDGMWYGLIEGRRIYFHKSLGESAFIITNEQFAQLYKDTDFEIIYGG